MLRQRSRDEGIESWRKARPQQFHPPIFLKSAPRIGKIEPGRPNKFCGQVRLPERHSKPQGLLGRGSPLHRRGS